MLKRTLIGGLSAIALAVVIASPANACDGWYGDHGWYGGGMMGPGMMGNYGPGMMGSGMMGWGQSQQQANLNLSANDVKVYLERWIASTGNPNIKVGSVVEKDASTIAADVVTKDNTVVQKFIFDRRSGSYRPTP